MIDPSRNLARCARLAPRRSTRPTAWLRIETGLSMVFAAGGGREQILGSKGPRPGPTRTATRCGREPQQPANPRSTGPRPAQSFVDRVVVDAEVLRDRADANAAVTHRRGPRRDRLVDRRLDRLGEIRLNLNLGNGSSWGHASCASRGRGPRRGRRPPASRSRGPADRTPRSAGPLGPAQRSDRRSSGGS